MDPISALAVAQTAYAAIRKGFQVGKEVESMAGDLGRWMGAIQNIKASHGIAKSRRFGSVEEEALESFAALKKAEQMENELRNFVIGHYGMNAWQQIIRLQGEIRKRKKEEEIARQQFIDDLIIWGLIASCIALTLGFVVWLIMAM